MLSHAQTAILRNICVAEFRPYIQAQDPHYGGFARVSPWVNRRKVQLFEQDALFSPEVLGDDVRKYYQARTFRL